MNTEHHTTAKKLKLKAMLHQKGKTSTPGFAKRSITLCRGSERKHI